MDDNVIDLMGDDNVICPIGLNDVINLIENDPVKAVPQCKISSSAGVK